MLRAVSSGGSPLFSSSPVVSGKENGSGLFLPSSVVFGGEKERRNNGCGRISMAAFKEGGPMTGIVFQPFEEVKSDNFLVPTSPQASLARQSFVDDCESAINEQIK